MTGVVILLGVVALLGAIAFVVSLRKNPDTVSVRGSEKVFGDDDVGRRVQAAMVAMWSQPDDNAAAVAQLIDGLKADRRAVMAEIARAYRAVPTSDYNLRWALTNLASMMGDVEALPFLDTVIASEVPPESSGDRHRFPTISRELMIRIRALEGVRALATGGTEAARPRLLDYLESPHFSIRKSAALGLLSLPDGSTYRRQIMELLPRDEHFVLDIRERGVEEAGVIRYPEGFTRDAIERTASPAPDLVDGPGATPRRTPESKGPPTI